MSWKQNEQSIATNESNTEMNLCIQQDMLKNINVQINIETTSNNLQNKTNSSENIQDEYEKNTSLIINQAVNKNVSSVNNEKIILNHKYNKNEKSKIDMNVTENIENSKCILESNIEQKRKCDENEKVIDQLSQIDIPEFFESSIEKSTDFLKSNSSKVILGCLQRKNSESLIAFTNKKRNHTKSSSIKYSINDDQNNQNINTISIKKIRISDEENDKLVCENRAACLSIENDIKAEISRSPSLFDDSLNLDTQICNVLEQNIIDSLHFSEFEDTKLSEQKVIENKVTTYNVNNEIEIENDIKNKNINQNSLNSLNSINSQIKHNMISWKDDSWNESKKITEKLHEIKDKNNEDVLIKCGIRNVKNTNIQHIIGSTGINDLTPEMKKKSDLKFEKTTNISDLKKISQIYKFKNESIARSPLASIVFNKNHASSSNKSDLDDIIVASQNTNSPVTSNKIRIKLDSERKRKIYTQKISDQISDDKNNAIIISNNKTEIRECKIKPKLKEILAQNILSSKNYNIDNIISNSDEDTPIKSSKILKKPKISLKRTQNNSEMCIQANELVDTSNEMINWNTLNIIKIGSDRGTFNLFKREVMQKRYIALALNCELYNDEINNIGAKIIGSSSESKKKSKKMENYVHGDKKLYGASIAWESNIAYYISFSNEQGI